MSQNHVQPVLEACQQSWQLKIYDVSITQYTEIHTLHETLYWFVYSKGALAPHE